MNLSVAIRVNLICPNWKYQLSMAHTRITSPSKQAILAKFLDTRSPALETDPIAYRSIPNTSNQLPWTEKRIQS